MDRPLLPNGRVKQAVIDAARLVAEANERSAATRERRAAAAARAEARRPAAPSSPGNPSKSSNAFRQRLPEKLGFDPDEPRDADELAGSLERLTGERERIGPVNLVAESELAELERRARRGAAEQPRS